MTKFYRFFILFLIVIVCFTIEANGKTIEDYYGHITASHFVTTEIPLDRDLISYIEKMSADHGIDPFLMIGLIHVETGGTFRTDLISITDDYGLCQLNARYIKYHCELFHFPYELFEPFNPYHSVYISVNMLSSLYRKYRTDFNREDITHYVLGCYNRGETGMQRYGGLETEYSQAVIYWKNYYKSN